MTTTREELPRADPYIDAHETQAYGPFTIAQVESLVVPIDPAFKKSLTHVTTLLAAATSAVAAALEAAGELDVVTYKNASSDPVAAARDVLKRAVRYAESRPGGERIADEMLQGETISTALRRRPTKLVGLLGHAVATFDRHAKQLPEHKSWAEELGSAKEALDTLDKSVRASRTERRAMTPEIAAARSEWLRVYGAAKLVVEAVLRLHEKTARMSEVFDDLAEVHRVKGVRDDAAPTPPA
jgi:hypothetical protein